MIFVTGSSSPRPRIVRGSVANGVCLDISEGPLWWCGPSKRPTSARRLSGFPDNVSGLVGDDVPQLCAQSLRALMHPIYFAAPVAVRSPRMKAAHELVLVQMHDARDG